MKEIPKCIQKKCKQLEIHCNKAYELKCEIEDWAEKQGADIYSDGWRKNALSDYEMIIPITLDGLKEYFKECDENE